MGNLNAVSGPILAHLSAERGRLLGDTVALPLFLLESFSLRFAVHAGLGQPDTALLALVEDCLDELGLDRDLSRLLEREAGWITLLDDGDEPEIRHSDVIKAARPSSCTRSRSSGAPRRASRGSRRRSPRLPSRSPSCARN